MTQNNGKAPDTTVDGWTVPIDPANPGLGRRTVLAGAAWSVPVIAAAIATPLAAASVTEPTLEFGGPYTVDGCGTLTGVAVTATTDGTTSAPGAPVVVSLPAGFTWADGTTGTKTVTTDGNGQAILPGIVAPGTGGTFTLNATGNGTTAVGTIATTPTAGALFSRGGDVLTTTPNGLPIVDVAAFVDGATGDRVAHILTTDGTIWVYNFETGSWAGQIGATNPDVTFIDYSSDGTTQSGVLAGSAPC